MRPRPTPALLAAVVLASALAGCGGKEGDGDPPEPGTPAAEYPMLHGWVVDQAIRPLAGVKVRVLETNDTATTGEDGYFGFTDVPRGETLVIVAEAAGFQPLSKQTRLDPEGVRRLNFTLEPIPPEVPYSRVLTFEGRIECQYHVVGAGETEAQPCAGETATGANVWEFAVEPDLAGAVLEIAWEASLPTAASLGARLETLGLGDQNQVLAKAVGTTVLRLDVPRIAAERYYESGGHMRLTVYVEPNVDETEGGAGAGIAVNQEFEAFASLFYVEGPPPSYSVQDA